jgi:hypothetical protein
MSDTHDLHTLDVGTTKHEKFTMDVAFRLGGLDDEMDAVLAARRQWFESLLSSDMEEREKAMLVRVMAVDRILDAIKMRRQSIKDRAE